MKKCKCKNIIPLGRVKLGYNTCVDCSTTQQYSYVPIIANKQVLEVQIVSQEVSDAVHRSSRRKQYGGEEIGDNLRAETICHTNFFIQGEV